MSLRVATALVAARPMNSAERAQVDGAGFVPGATSAARPKLTMCGEVEVSLNAPKTLGRFALRLRNPFA